MQAKPRISVITVCYNSEATLSRSLQSVVDQDWEPVEHIVIDGASTDGTLAIIEGFRDHLSHAVSEKDDGIYDAMNKGLRLATGDIICFLNSDDYYAHAQVLSAVANRMLETGVQVLMGDVAFFHSKNPSKLYRRYRSNQFYPDRLAYGWQPAHPALFITRSVISKVGNFDPKYRIAGDFEYIIRIFKDKNLAYSYMPEVMVYMQSGGASTSGLKGKVTHNRELLIACRENEIDTNIVKILSRYPKKILELFIK